jgi:hypothetical protein
VNPTGKEADHLLHLFEKNICPNCGMFIPEGKRVGSGKRAEGGFCSLTCFTNYNGLKLVERFQLVESILRLDASR